VCRVMAKRTDTTNDIDGMIVKLSFVNDDRRSNTSKHDILTASHSVLFSVK